MFSIPVGCQVKARFPCVCTRFFNLFGGITFCGVGFLLGMVNPTRGHCATGLSFCRVSSQGRKAVDMLHGVEERRLGLMQRILGSRKLFLFWIHSCGILKGTGRLPPPQKKKTKTGEVMLENHRAFILEMCHGVNTQWVHSRGLIQKPVGNRVPGRKLEHFKEVSTQLLGPGFPIPPTPKTHLV